MNSTSNPVILITGASSGIGAASARLFGREGYRLVLAARRKAQIEALTGELQVAGAEVLPVVCDVTDLDQIRNLVEVSLAHFGQIDILFNNAGYGRMNWLERLDPVAEVESQLATNLLGLIQLTQAVLPQMIARQRGHIINMASIAGLIGTPTYSVYAASKFGLRGFTESLRREVGIHGIRVSGIYPGGVATEFGEKTGIERKTGIRTPPGLRLTAAGVAREVLRIAGKPRRMVVIPRLMWAAIWLNQFFPALVDWAIERQFTRRERAG